MERMNNLHCLFCLCRFFDDNKQCHTKKTENVKINNTNTRFQFQHNELHSTKYAIIVSNLSNCFGKKVYSFCAFEFPLLLNLPLNCEPEFVHQKSLLCHIYQRHSAIYTKTEHQTREGCSVRECFIILSKMPCLSFEMVAIWLNRNHSSTKCLR